MDSRPDNKTFEDAAYKAAFGEVVYKRRVDAGLNRQLFSRMAGGGASHVCRIESGEAAPSIVTVRKLAEALGSKPSDLLDEADELLRRRR